MQLLNIAKITKKKGDFTQPEILRHDFYTPFLYKKGLTSTNNKHPHAGFVCTEKHCCQGGAPPP